MNNRIKQRYEKSPIMDARPDDGQCVSGGGYHHPNSQWDRRMGIMPQSPVPPTTL